MKSNTCKEDVLSENISYPCVKMNNLTGDKKSIKSSSLYCQQFEDVAKRIVKEQKASISMVQRLFKISFPKAKAYIEELENLGYIEKNGRYYKVLISQKIFDNLK